MKYFTKEAKLDLGDIEDELGIYLHDPLEDEARDLIEKQRAKRVALRKPSVGILTLGIAPAIAKNKAKDEIIRRMARSHVDLGNRLIDRKREKDRQALEYYRANAAPRAAGMLGLTAMQMKR